MSTLYRATVQHRKGGSEYTVFFECSRRDPLDHLGLLMSLTWDTHEQNVEISNLHSESELLGMAAFSGPEGGDLRLFETGWFRGPLYALPQRTLILTSPVTAQRLQALQQQVQQLHRIAASDLTERLDRQSTGAAA